MNINYFSLKKVNTVILLSWCIFSTNIFGDSFIDNLSLELDDEVREAKGHKKKPSVINRKPTPVNNFSKSPEGMEVSKVKVGSTVKKINFLPSSQCLIPLSLVQDNNRRAWFNAMSNNSRMKGSHINNASVKKFLEDEKARGKGSCSDVIKTANHLANNVNQSLDISLKYVAGSRPLPMTCRGPTGGSANTAVCQATEFMWALTGSVYMCHIACNTNNY